MKMAKRLKYLPLIYLLCMGIQTRAQDTLRITLPDAETIFLQKNLQLLASKYNIDAQRALILQAKAYPNPNFGYDVGVYNPNDHKWFDFTASGEQAAQLSQLVLLAGKRNQQIAMAKTNTTLADHNFMDLLRTLRYSLRTDFISIYYWQQTAGVYDEEINGLKTVVRADQMQLAHGFIPKTQLVRDEAQLYSLQSEYNDLVNQINDAESEMRVMLDTVATNIYIIPLLDTASLMKMDPLKYPLTTLLDSAASNRTDLLIANDNLLLSRQNLKLQKANAVPDITLSAGFDQNGNAWPDYTSLGISFDLPVFTLNRGNIRSAKYAIKSNEATLGSTSHTMEENVARALQLAVTERKLYDGLDKNFPAQFDSLARETLNQYMKRNMNILDFLTFYDAYKTNVVQLNYIMASMANAFENIDYMTGSDFFFK